MAQSIVLRIGDCKIVIEGLDDASIQVFISDPPYDLTGDNKKSSKRKKKVAKKGFMGNTWDATGITFDPEFWKLLYQKGTPGCIVKFFGASRTYHKMCRAMERGGFVDVKFGKNWIYGSGFPKSTNVSKQIDRVLGKVRKVVGTKKGIGGENLNDIVRGSKHVRDTSRTGAKGIGAYGTGAKQVSVDVEITAPESEEAIKYDGVGTACKPAWEPIIQARKPLEDAVVPMKEESEESFEATQRELAELLGAVNFEEVEPEDLDIEGTLQSLQEAVEEYPEEDELEMKLREYVRKLASEIMSGEGQLSLPVLEQMLRECGEDSAAHQVLLHTRDYDPSIFGDDGEDIDEVKADLESEEGENEKLVEKLVNLEDEREDWEEKLEEEKVQWEKERNALESTVDELHEQMSEMNDHIELLTNPPEKVTGSEDAISNNS